MTLLNVILLVCIGAYVHCGITPTEDNGTLIRREHILAGTTPMSAIYFKDKKLIVCTTVTMNTPIVYRCGKKTYRNDGSIVVKP